MQIIIPARVWWARRWGNLCKETFPAPTARHWTKIEFSRYGMWFPCAQSGLTRSYIDTFQKRTSTPCKPACMQLSYPAVQCLGLIQRNPPPPPPPPTLCDSLNPGVFFTPCDPVALGSSCNGRREKQ